MSVRLAFDTSTPEGSVALRATDGRVVERSIGSRVRHAESLLPTIAEVLAEAGLAPADTGGIVVGAGPGSFTGVRIAAATARGLVRALDVPLFTYGSLLAEAAAAQILDTPVCAVFDARRDEVYAACYRFSDVGWSTLMEPEALSVAALTARLSDLAPVWTGEGAGSQERRLPGRRALRTITRAAALLQLARMAPDAGRCARPAHWEPDYLRPPGAERAR
jgi:tRNA threonylcarbamoyladenosine biosynthesis protein TsaB